jgi:hypothetical protein
MSARTIDEVIERLGVIIEQSIATQDRRGYFAALYNRVTCRVRDGIARGEFEDGARMERLDVVFANLYLDAYDTYARGDLPSKPWTRAFEATSRPGLFVIQHLLLGMNAHITLDLGIAAAQVAPGGQIHALREDYLRINTLLASLVDTVEDTLEDVVGRWSPGVGAALWLADRAAGNLDESAASLMMVEARDLAWKFALDLANGSEGKREEIIAQQEGKAALVSDTLLIGAPLADLLARFADRDVADDIRILARGEVFH